MKKKGLALILLATTIMVSGCGSASSSKYAATTDAYYDEPYYNGYDYMAEAEEVAYDDYSYPAEESMTAYSGDTGSSLSTTENASTSNRKLIRNVSLDVETKDFDSLTQNLYNSISDCGGYIESMNIYNGSSYRSSRDTRNANITARIPAKQLDSFVNTIGEAANITNRSESVDDVTLSYVDMTSHRDMLKEEQQRLLDFLAEADNVEEIIALEDRLTNVKYQLESMESQIRTYDNQVDYSTVRISVSEVKEFTPEPVETKTTWERISEGFHNSLKDIGEGFTELFISFVINLPYIVIGLIFIAIAAVVIILLIKANNRSVEKRKAKRLAQPVAVDTTVSANEVKNDTTSDNKDSNSKSDKDSKKIFEKKPNK